MIEKLKPQITEKDGGAFGIIVERKFATDEEIQEKINELVDAVNELGSYVGPLGVKFIEPKPVEFTEPNIADPYAEQRKWIGKICKFWDDDNTNSSCGILTSIDTETFKEPQFVCNDEYDYEHCEPVKPDDDIVYKGGDNDKQ